MLLLDEPTSGLDHGEAGRLGALIESLKVAGECAVILVEHDVNSVMHHSDRVVVLHLGEVLATGAPGDIRRTPSVRAAYLGDG